MHDITCAELRFPVFAAIIIVSLHVARKNSLGDEDFGYLLPTDAHNIGCIYLSDRFVDDLLLPPDGQVFCYAGIVAVLGASADRAALLLEIEASDIL